MRMMFDGSRFGRANPIQELEAGGELAWRPHLHWIRLGLRLGGVV